MEEEIAKMPKREFLQLAHVYNPKKHGIGGWYASEKLDGQRCFWDGGVSRGQEKKAVPWANTDKDERYKTQQVATGLWSRYGNVIHAPDWWLDALPNIPLDGELYMQGHRQELMSIIKALQPGDGWRDVSYYIFDAVPIETLLEPGIINNTNFKKRITELASHWYNVQGALVTWMPQARTGFVTRLARLKKVLNNNQVAILHEQRKLPMQTSKAIEEVGYALLCISTSGGEGLILRAPNALYECCRTHAMVKVKKLDDAEGTVVGYITGRRTDLGSKLLGMMGALILEIEGGKRLELSGFTDKERLLIINDITEESVKIFEEELSEQEQKRPTHEVNMRVAHAWASEHPEQEVPFWIEACTFPRGSKVTFKYRGKSKDGIPQEARYWRRRDDE